MLPSQHLPVLKIRSCPCEGTPKLWPPIFQSTNLSAADRILATLHRLTPKAMPAVFPDAGHIAASLESNVARTPPTGFRVFPMTMAPPFMRMHSRERPTIYRFVHHGSHNIVSGLCSLITECLCGEYFQLCSNSSRPLFSVKISESVRLYQPYYASKNILFFVL